MAKTKTKYVCQSCGYESLQWLGKCTNCNAWNSFVEEKETVIKTQLIKASRKTTPQPINEINTEDLPRITTGIAEFDRVMGGGFCPGSITLLGGEPGIGKSTISLQIAQMLSVNHKILYISGEESPQQIKLRGERLNALSENILLLSATNILDIEKAIEESNPGLIIIDSIQTIYHPELFSAPGSVGQIRESAAYLIKFLKENNYAAIFIGHVTKEGSIAGPKVLEHMVDTVLYFEGERTQNFRIVRSIKNRFGSTNEIGIFDMQAEGLVEIKNPSEIFIQESSLEIPGTMVVSAMEGTRSFLIEVQSLVSHSFLSMPRRTFTGIDGNRASIILAVLEKKCGLHISTQDVFINVVGGVNIDDPAADLGIALAITSSFKDKPYPKKICAIGEIGLGGELRTVSHIEKRINEVEKLGFTTCIIPFNNLKTLKSKYTLEIITAKTVMEALAKVG